MREREGTPFPQFFCEGQGRAEAVECPGPMRFLDALENIFYSSRKVSDDLFYQLSNFRTIRSLDAPSSAASCPGNDIFSSFFAIYLHFLHKTGPLDAPQGGCPGPSYRPHPLLHATDRKSI